MLISLSIIILAGLILGAFFKMIKLPSLIGLLLAGIIIGPSMLNLISSEILLVSKDLRQIALIIILMRAGLSLNIEDLKQIGRPALWLSFAPAVLEISAVAFLAPLIFNISLIDALMMGAVLAAVSPAIIVPGMMKLMDKGYGKEKKIPQLILASASVDDVIVIVLFTVFLKMAQGEGFEFSRIAFIPVTIILGVLLGFMVGYLLVIFFKRVHMRDTLKMMIIFSISFIFVYIETAWTFIPISGLLAVMTLGVTILHRYEILAKRLMSKFSKSWVIAELILFILVGAAVDISMIGTAGYQSILLIVAALLIRLGGVQLCLIKTNLNLKERIFTSISFIPKATVQAAIGTIPLQLGLASGNLILSVAVIAVLLTAPIGAMGIDYFHPKLLVKSQ